MKKDIQYPLKNGGKIASKSHLNIPLLIVAMLINLKKNPKQNFIVKLVANAGAFQHQTDFTKKKKIDHNLMRLVYRNRKLLDLVKIILQRKLSDTPNSRILLKVKYRDISPQFSQQYSGIILKEKVRVWRYQLMIRVDFPKVKLQGFLSCVVFTF